MVYTVLESFLALVTQVFFRRIEVEGLERVPRDGPVIFVGNHPNSLIDPVLILTTCGRRVHFAAKDVLFESAPLRVLLTAMGAVPIRRRKDHPDGALDNSAAFAALNEVLHSGGAFGIFPEGISHLGTELAPLKTGAARIALGAAEEGIPIRIVPCGLSYFRRHRMRSRVLVQFGQPIVLDEAHVEAHRADSREAARDLTDEIDLALRAQTLNAPDFETLRVLEGVRRLYTPLDVELSLAERAEITRRVLQHYAELKDDPDIARLFEQVREYLFALDCLGMKDAELEKGPTAGSTVFRMVKHLFLCLVLVPFALPGVVLHAPILVLAVVAGETLSVRKDVTATTKLMSATVMVMAAYAAVVGLVLAVFPFPEDLIWAAWALAGLLLSGWATIRVLERQGQLRRGLWVLLQLAAGGRQVKKLQARRAALRDAVLGAVDRYLDPDVERVVPASAQGPAASG